MRLLLKAFLTLSLGLTLFQPRFLVHYFETTYASDPVHLSETNDPYGNDLPPGALALYGSNRLKIGYCNSLVFSLDEKLMASCGPNNAITLWDMNSGRMRSKLLIPTSILKTVTFSPDNKFVAASDQDGKLWICDLTTNRLPKEITASKYPICALAISSDGRIVATSGPDPDRNVGAANGLRSPSPDLLPEENPRNQIPFDADRTVRLWDVASGKEISRFTIKQERIHALCFLPNSEFLAIGSKEGSLTLCQSRSGKVIQNLYSSKEMVFQIRSSVSHFSALIGSRLFVWHLPSLKTFSLPQEFQTNVVCHDLSQNGRYLVAGTQREIRLFDLQSNKELKAVELTDPYVSLLAVSSSGKNIAFASRGYIRLCDSITGNELFKDPRHNGQIKLIDFLAGDQFFSLDESLNGFIWDRKSGKALNSFSIHGNRPFGEMWSNGTMFGVPFVDRVSFYSLPRGIRKADFKVKSPPSLLRNVVFSPSAKKWAVIELETWSHIPIRGQIHLLDGDSGALSSSMESVSLKHNKPCAFEGLVVSPDGKYVATGGNVIRIWDIDSGKILKELYDGTDVKPIHFLSDGKLIAERHKLNGLGFQLEVGLLDTWNGKLVRKLPVSVVDTLCVSINSRFMAIKGWSQNADKTIIREWPSLKRIAILDSGRSTYARFSRDDKSLITGEQWGNLLLWDMPTILKPSKTVNKTLSQAQFEKMWEDLSDDGLMEKAFDELAEFPEDTVNHLKNKTKPIPKANLDEFISKLDSEVFSERNDAFNKLKKMEFAPFEKLQAALKDKKMSAEGQRRVHQLLTDMDALIEDDEWNRQWNAVVVLEQIGNEEARQMLELLAAGLDGARLTTYAKEALIRLRTDPKTPAAP